MVLHTDPLGLFAAEFNSGSGILSLEVTAAGSRSHTGIHVAAASCRWKSLRLEAAATLEFMWQRHPAAGSHCGWKPQPHWNSRGSGILPLEVSAAGSRSHTGIHVAAASCRSKTLRLEAAATGILELVSTNTEACLAKTRPGGFSIGFRRGWGDWQRDLSLLIAFARDNDFEFIDFGPAPRDELRRVLDAGLGVGSVDLKDWKALVSPDAARRGAAIDANIQYVCDVTALGISRFLVVVSPEDPARKRQENFDLAVDSFGQLAAAIRPTGAKIVIEGSPGPAPWHGSIACTPADARAFFAAIAERFGAEAADAVGLNFDPSHLVRMGINPDRFLAEFLPRIHHVHGKDTELSAEGLYAHGNLQPATFAAPPRFGGQHWRYAIPGRGAVPWASLLSALKVAGYTGGVSIELEDEQFNGTEAGEKQGLLASRDFLAGDFCP